MAFSAQEGHSASTPSSHSTRSDCVRSTHPEEVLFQMGFASPAHPQTLPANFNSRTLRAGSPGRGKQLLSSLSWAPNEMGFSLQSVSLRVSHPHTHALMSWMLCGMRRGGRPASPDGGQPTRATVLKLSLAHPSKASNGHNSYLQCTGAFTAWDPTGLYKRNKLTHALTRRRLSQPLRGAASGARGSSCRSARSPRTQWPGQGGKNGRAPGGLALPRADTLSLCDSDLTEPFDSAASLPVILGSQLRWPHGCLFCYNRGPPTPANNKPEFKKQHLG